MSHSFLYVPELSIPFLGGELMCKLNAQITFLSQKQELHLQFLPENALQLQVLLVCLESREREIVPPEIYEAMSTAV